MVIEHVAVWARDLEPGPFGEGARLELMHRPALGPSPTDAAVGYAHIALALGSRNAVDAAVAALRVRGVPIES
jgi:lactoylglutathione lyase